MSFQERRAKFAALLESLYLCLFALILAFSFLKITSFNIPWQMVTRTGEGKISLFSKIFLEQPYYAMQAVIVLRLLIQETYDWKRMLTAAIVLGSGYYLWSQNDSSRIILFLVLMLGAWKISYRRIIQVFFLVVGILFLVTFVCGATGVIEDYTYIRSEEVIRHSYGIVAPTNFGAMVFFLMLFWWYLRKEKTTYWEAASALLMAGGLQWKCNARCSSALLTVMAVLMAGMRYWYQNKERKFLPMLADVLVLSPIFVATGSILLTINYKNTEFWLKLNELLSNRLQLGRKGLDVFRLKPYGQYIRMFSGAEGIGDRYYFYIDSFYIQLALMYGLVILGAALLILLIIGCKAKRQEDWILLWMIGLAAVHGIIEPHVIELPYCPLALALLADLDHRPGMTVKEIVGTVWIKN